MTGRRPPSDLTSRSKRKEGESERERSIDANSNSEGAKEVKTSTTYSGGQGDQVEQFTYAGTGQLDSTPPPA